MTKTSKTIVSQDAVGFQIIDGRLIENMDSTYNTKGGRGIGRRITLEGLGKILRGYKTTKSVPLTDLKAIRVYYGPDTTHGNSFAYAVKVAVNGPRKLSIGCVRFYGQNAVALRRAALKSSKKVAA